MQRVIVGYRQHANRGIMQPTTSKHMMGGLRKIKDTVISHNSVTLLTVVIVVDDVGGFTQMPSKNVPHIILRVADVAKQTTGLRCAWPVPKTPEHDGQLDQLWQRNKTYML